jgi:hypothetical protein
MRKLIDIILEAQRPTMTRTRPDMSTIVPSVDQGGSLSNSRMGSVPTTAPMGTTSTAVDTARAMSQANINVPSGMMSDAMGLDVTDHMSDADAAAIAGHAGFDATPRTSDNLPAMISMELERTDGAFEPTWHQVKHLPGYLQSAIRGTARQVFDRFTTTPIEDIQMMCTMLDPEADVRKMMAWIMNNGHEVDKMTFDFSAQIRGYTADFSVWRAGGYEFGLCKDMGGYYVYGWPENDAQVTDRTNNAPDSPLSLN